MQPPGVGETAEIEMRELRYQLRRAAPDIAAAHLPFPVQRRDLDRDTSAEDALRRLDRPRQGRGQHDVIVVLPEALARLSHLALSEVGQAGIEMDRIDAGCRIMRVERGLAVADQVDKTGHRAKALQAGAALIAPFTRQIKPNSHAITD